jgi:hypothetical protein
MGRLFEEMAVFLLYELWCHLIGVYLHPEYIIVDLDLLRVI